MKKGIYIGPNGQLVFAYKCSLTGDYFIQWSELPIFIPYSRPFVQFVLDGWEYLGSL